MTSYRSTTCSWRLGLPHWFPPCTRNHLSAGNCSPWFDFQRAWYALGHVHSQLFVHLCFTFPLQCSLFTSEPFHVWFLDELWIYFQKMIGKHGQYRVNISKHLVVNYGKVPWNSRDMRGTKQKNGFAVGLVISRLTEDFDHEELSSFTSEVKGCGGLE